MRRLCSPLVVVTLLIAGAPPLAAQQAKFDVIGFFPPTYPWESQRGNSDAFGVSDGGAVVGECGSQSAEPRAFRWTKEGGLEDLKLLWPTAYLNCDAYGISANGRVVVGQSLFQNYPRACVWTSDGEFRELAHYPGRPVVRSEARDATPDGSIVVGCAAPPNKGMQPARWTPSGIEGLGTLHGSFAEGTAYGVSADGNVVVGDSYSVTTGSRLAFRWTPEGGMQDLGSLWATAYDVSADGSTVVGYGILPSNKYGPFVHTATGGIEALPPVVVGDTPQTDGGALAVSGDGRVVVGYTVRSTPENTGFHDACLWIDRQPYSLRTLLVETYGVNLDDFTAVDVLRDVSTDGTILVGTGRWQRYNDRAFRVILRPDFQPPTLETDVEEGEAFTVKVGETFSASFLGTDPDGEGLTLTATGLPDGATLTPASGSTSTSPIDAELNWTPTGNDFGSSHEITIAFDDGYANGKVSRTFTIEVPENEAPTVLPLGPQTIECDDGQHLVTLSTTIDDADGDSLSVTWTVDGEVANTDSGVAAGTKISFEHDYPHGVHAVSLEVSDGYETTTAGTTVTVQDTVAPIVTVAEDVVAPTDAGKDFATGVVLPEPEVSDGSGHDVTLTSDAPEIYLLGETIVTWTAEDEFGNETTATQKVIVEDREAPKLTGIASMLALLDQGKIYSTMYLPPPEATDNVDRPWEIQIVNDAPLRLPVGTTRVTFTATDRAGNASTWPMDVRVVNYRPFANAGGNILVTTKSERGARVRLDGRWSSDRDAHRLKFFWSAPGVKFAGEKSDRPSGFFPVGVTQVLLTVTDPLGKTDVDRVRVVVRLKDARHRPLGAAANEAFAAAARQAANAASPAGSSGLSYANAALSLGDAAGEFVRWGEGQSEADALLAYAELRALQQAYGEAAGLELLSAYAQTGDENLLTAYGQAAYGSLAAEADLREP